MGTLGAALDVREVASAGNLLAHVEGDIAEVDGVLRITAIRLRYEMKIPAGKRDKAERALETYADKCPAYQSVKGCIDCSWEVEMAEHC